MTAIDDRILERVRKLLAKAEHPNTPAPEAEALSEKAGELMARYALDAAMLERDSGARGRPEARTVLVAAPYALPKAVLLSKVAAAYRVRTVILGDTSDGRRCTLVGFAADLAVTELLFTSLLLQAATAMLAASSGQRRVRAFRHAFLLGYATVVGGRLEAAQRRAVDDAAGEARSAGAASTALVLADRVADVDRAVAELYPHLRGLRTTASDLGGLSAGRAAGAGASLSTGRDTLTGRRPSLPPADRPRPSG